MSDFQIDVLRAAARRLRRLLTEQRARLAGEVPDGAEPELELERRADLAERQLAAAQERRRSGA